MKLLSTFLLLALFGKLTLYAQTLPDDVRASIKSRIDNQINTGIVVGILDASGTKYFSEGVKSLKTKEPVNESSVFEIGSITKTFTGILLADKVIRREVSLEDPLQQYLPPGVTAPEYNGNPIRLINLSNHTSSLPSLPDNFKPGNPNNPYADYSEKQLYEFLSSYKLTRDVGSQYEYSNYAVGLLGHQLAVKDKKTYEQLVTDIILVPLELKNTRITLTPDMKKNLASGYSDGVEVPGWDLPTLAGAGAIRSTAVDMMKYLNANMGNVKTKLYPAMQLSHTNTRGANANPMVGLGWHIAKAGDKQIIWHNGGTGGYRSFIGFIRGEQKAVVVLSNSSASIDDIAMHLLESSSPLQPVATNKAIALDAAVLEKYVGRYQLAPSFILTVTRKDAQLMVQATGQQDLPVFAKSSTEFFYKAVDAQLTFTLNSQGVTESVTLHQGGREMVAKKLTD